MDISDEATKANCLDWSTGPFSVMLVGFDPDSHFTKDLSKNAEYFILPAEMLLSLRVATTKLLSYTRQRSTSILQGILFLQNVLKRS
jgi:hypothetical protein